MLLHSILLLYLCLLCKEPVSFRAKVLFFTSEVFSSVLCSLLVLGKCFKFFFCSELALFFHSFIWKVRVGIANKGEGCDKERENGTCVLVLKENNSETHLLMKRLLTFSFPSIIRGGLYSFLFFSPRSLPPSCFVSGHYPICAGPPQSALSPHTPKCGGLVCGTRVQAALSFPVTFAHRHQTPNSRVSSFLAKYTCRPELHRSRCLF